MCQTPNQEDPNSITSEAERHGSGKKKTAASVQIALASSVFVHPGADLKPPYEYTHCYTSLASAQQPPNPLFTESNADDNAVHPPERPNTMATSKAVGTVTGTPVVLRVFLQALEIAPPTTPREALHNIG